MIASYYNYYHTPGEFAYPATGLTYNEFKYVYLPPSTTIGLEAKAGNWRFRGFGTINIIKSYYNVYAPNYTEAQSTARSLMTTYSAGVGIGWVKLPWAINFQFNPDLLNSTIDLISGNPLTADPILSIQVNFLFDINAPAAN
jgi:hypothetical protein